MTGGLWFAAVASIVVGSGMLGFWSAALLSRSVPEVEAGSREIWFHVVAEALTGALLVAAGIATIAAPEARWSAVTAATAFGALGYTLIQSPGYYVERRNPAMVAMFAGFWAVTIPAVVLRFA